ncbi:RING finger protein 150-like, partial [Limulus polyphemus]|uniref:RING finger protein 150-like n=1 Tax=Limulus polyphemus TaxID=6850 RepID=A0ABM1BBW1_LIMPO
MSCYLNYSVSKLFGWCWWFYFLLLVVLMDCFGSVVNCEFTYGYGAQEYTLALINITYTHPVTGKIHSEKNEIGKFTSGKIGSANGVVVHVSSNNHTMHDGCNPFDSEIIPHEPWIALIAHGYCRDTIKLQHAVENNASAAIIYSNEYNSFGLQLHHQVFDLVAVFISEEEGEKIAALVDNGTRVDIHISVGTPNTFRYANINRTSVLFVSISFIILMIISLAWLVFYYVQRFRYIHAKDILA